jgi:transketolase
VNAEPAARLASEQDNALDRLCVDTIRALSMDAVQQARSGHPGLPMAMAPVAYVLYSRFLRFDPADPQWPDRDRFVLSAGHGSMLLYSVLHLAGYDLALSEIERFRQWGSRTPGHPERGVTPGVETTTGPLGQGFANGVGMALAERFLRERYGREVMDHRVFALCSDGDLMEGVASEAASLAGHLGLGRLVYLYDDNGITIDGETSLSFATEDVEARFRAYGWHTSAGDQAGSRVGPRRAVRRAGSGTWRVRCLPSARGACPPPLARAPGSLVAGEPRARDRVGTRLGRPVRARARACDPGV